MPTAPLARVMDSERLPTIPAVAVKIVDLVQRPDVSIELLGETIAADPALAARVLRTANSGFYGRPRSVTRIRDAILVLGLRTVKTLALGFSLVGDLRGHGGKGVDHTWLWQRSLLTATIGRTLSARAGKRVDDEAFLGGLLHMLGIIALEQALGDEYDAVGQKAGPDVIALAKAESKRFGIDHPRVGAALGERWNLPSELVDAIRYAPSPEEAPEASRTIARCVFAAGQAADLMLGGGSSPAHLAKFRKCCAEWFGCSKNEVEDIIASAVADCAALSATLDIPETDVSAPEVLARANEALIQLSLEAERENVGLKNEREQLITRASTDGLTGLANRRHFHEFLEEHFRLSIRYGTPLSLFMMDLDRFKVLNDSYGHPAGDEVLREVASLLKSLMRDADLVARYGGEEFVVVLPSTPIDGAFQSAERVRVALEARRILVDGHEIRVTASFGVGAYRADPLMTPDWLIKETDLALYEAKAAGRNLVRAYGDESRAAA